MNDLNKLYIVYLALALFFANSLAAKPLRLTDAWLSKNQDRTTLNLSHRRIIGFERIAHLRSLRQLILDDAHVDTLRGLSQLPQLQKLSLAGCRVTATQSTQEIAKLDKLVHLNLSGLPIDSRVLPAAPLRYLDLSATKITNLDFVRNYPALENLTLQATSIRSLAGIERLTRLKKLNIEVTQVTTLAPLRTLTQLVELDVTATPIDSLVPLKGLKLLEILDISRTRKLGNIGILRHLSKLRELYLTGNRQITDFGPISKLTRLRILYLSETSVGDDSLPRLQNLGELRALGLARTRVGATSSLSGLLKLRRLDLSRSRFFDLSRLRNLPKLYQLQLQRSRLRNVIGIERFKRLTRLNISRTSVTNAAPILRLRALKYLKAWRTPLDRNQMSKLREKLHRLYAD